MQDIHRSAFRQPAPKLIMGVNRKAFKSGKEGAVNMKNPLILREKRTATATYRTPNYRTTSFVAPDPVGRSPMSFERFLQLQALEQGFKVQLGPGTLSNMLKVKVPDPQNTSIMIEKNVPLSQLLQSNDGKLAAVDSLIREIQEAKYVEQGVTRDRMRLLGQMLGQMNKNIKNLSRGQQKRLIEATALTKAQKIQAKYDALKLPGRYISKDVLTDDNREAFLNHINDINDIQKYPGLSAEFPTWGADDEVMGTNEFKFVFNVGQVLDLETRKFYLNMESLPQEGVSITEVIDELLTPSRMPAKPKQLAIRSPSAAKGSYLEEKKEDPDAGLSLYEKARRTLSPPHVRRPTEHTIEQERIKARIEKQKYDEKLERWAARATAETDEEEEESVFTQWGDLLRREQETETDTDDEDLGDEARVTVRAKGRKKKKKMRRLTTEQLRLSKKAKEKYKNLPFKQRMKQIVADEKAEKEAARKERREARDAVRRRKAAAKAILQEKQNLDWHLKNKTKPGPMSKDLFMKQEAQRVSLAKQHLATYQKTHIKWFPIQHVDGDWFEISENLIDSTANKYHLTTVAAIWKLMGHESLGRVPKAGKDLPGGYLGAERRILMSDV